MTDAGRPLTHLDSSGHAHMVDVSGKDVSARSARATGRVLLSAEARTADRTGVEMEALTSVTVAALALIDMVKAVDPAAVISDVRVEEKTGGKTGLWRRP